jgi:hypothetical protein
VPGKVTREKSGVRSRFSRNWKNPRTVAVNHRIFEGGVAETAIDQERIVEIRPQFPLQKLPTTEKREI